MNAPSATAPLAKGQLSQAEHLRAEAAIEPDPVSTEAPKKETQVIAIYERRLRRANGSGGTLPL